MGRRKPTASRAAFFRAIAFWTVLATIALALANRAGAELRALLGHLGEVQCDNASTKKRTSLIHLCTAKYMLNVSIYLGGYWKISMNLAKL
jgi:hypothetical protein